MSPDRRSFLEAGAALAAGQLAKAAPNDRVTVGHIGAGARAHELMQAVMANPNTEIVGVVDAYTGRLERAVERTGGRAKVYRTHHDLLADKSIDAVVVATPDHWHKQIIIEALRAGKDVYSEKPLTYRSPEGVEIIEVARQTGRVVQVGSQGVSSPAEQTAKEWIKSGKLGQITMISASYNRNTAEGAWIYPIPPDASPKTVNWEMFLGPAPKRPFSLERFFRWRCYEDYSGGIATDLFVHLCTTIHHLMNAKMPSSVLAMGELYRWKESREVPETFRDPGPEATILHFGHFFDSVKSRQPYWEDATAGHRAAACAHMVNMSAKQRRLVQWDFDKDDIRA